MSSGHSMNIVQVERKKEKRKTRYRSTAVLVPFLVLLLIEFQVLLSCLVPHYFCFEIFVWWCFCFCLGGRIFFVIDGSRIAIEQTQTNSTQNRAGHGQPSRPLQLFRQQSAVFSHFHASHWKCRYYGNSIIFVFSRPHFFPLNDRIKDVNQINFQGPPPRNEATAETPTRSETMESAPTSALDLRLTDPSHLQELTARLELRGNFAIQPPDGDSETLRKVQQEKSKKQNQFNTFFYCFQYLKIQFFKVNLTVFSVDMQSTNSTTTSPMERGNSTGKNRSLKLSWKAFRYRLFST